MPYEFTSYTQQAREQVNKAVSEATEEVFQYDILADAKQESKSITGTNRRSLDVEFAQTSTGKEATLFSQSGYGGYLEVGTAKMKAQPYMWPAFKKFVKKIAVVVKEKLHG